MAGGLQFTLIAEDGAARAGRLTTPHGSIDTPAFMPVGTQAAVKAMAPQELWDIGYRLVLSNAYHLALRPGPGLIASLGGIGPFMGWGGAVLTDSGGFQAMSLAAIRRIDEQGIAFRSHLDGRAMLLTPESSIRIQEELGVDIMMALDECLGYPADAARTRASLELTTRWAQRSLRARGEQGPALFGIVQGGFFPALRRQSAGEITAMPFDGYAVGGLSVGEPKELMLEMAAIGVEQLPKAQPRYLMGVGTPADLMAAIAMGYDMFDCVLPTRNARNGSAFTSAGRLAIKNQRFAADARPLDENCGCRTCRSYSRAYLRHLFRAGEILAARALTEHNLYFYASLMRRAQAAIASGTYAQLARALSASPMARIEEMEETN
jgi:queuine tRNA-ribosyltransferase